MTDSQPTRFHSEAVIQSGEDENVEALRYWVWAAVQKLGGRLVIAQGEFYSTPGDATLHWNINPSTLMLTIVSNRGEEPADVKDA